MAVQNRTHVLWRLIEVPGELHLLIARCGNFRKRAFEVFGHFGANRVELNPEPLNPVFGCSGDRTSNEWACRHVAEKSASCHCHHVFPFEITSRRCCAKRETRSRKRPARSRQPYFFIVAPANSATPASVVCAALRPRRKSLSV